MTNISLDFEGPFTFMGGDKSVFHSEVATSSGIYLWTIRQRIDDTHLIHYVGETVSLAKRHREHLAGILGLSYGIFDPHKAQEGECELLWPGAWRDKTSDGPLRQIDAYQTVHDDVALYLAVLNIFFAKLDTGTRLRRVATHVLACGPLGARYPTKTWTAPNNYSCLKEGDTPSWFFFLPQGGNQASDPTQPGWGGRFAREPDGWYRDLPTSDSFDPRTTVSHWRAAYQADFAKRMQWCLPAEDRD